MGRWWTRQAVSGCCGRSLTLIAKRCESDRKAFDCASFSADLRVRPAYNAQNGHPNLRLATRSTSLSANRRHRQSDSLGRRQTSNFRTRVFAMVRGHRRIGWCMACQGLTPNRKKSRDTMLAGQHQAIRAPDANVNHMMTSTPSSRRTIFELAEQHSGWRWLGVSLHLWQPVRRPLCTLCCSWSWRCVPVGSLFAASQTITFRTLSVVLFAWRNASPRSKR